MNFRTHPNYQLLVEKARASRAANRDFRDITADDVALARLYSYAYRAHVIGAFHATQAALLDLENKTQVTSDGSSEAVRMAIELLADLAAQSLEPIAADFRAMVSTFYRYDTTIRRVVTVLEGAVDDPLVGPIAKRFAAPMERIALSGGIACTRDNEVPAQASFVVPALGITIVPLVYGDYHSWNVAYLTDEFHDVPRHQHALGVEIHLGLGPIRGHTLLSDQITEVNEGYAMAIPSRTAHGFVNAAEQEHYLPFVFGSKQLGGWGVCPDVAPQPINFDLMQRVPRTDKCLNGLVYLEREIERAATSAGNARWTLVKPEATYCPESGALVLSVARIADSGFTYPADVFRIVSVVSGRGVASVGPVEQPVSTHDHFGIPAGLIGSLQPIGGEPLVTLDATLVQELTQVG